MRPLLVLAMYLLDRRRHENDRITRCPRELRVRVRIPLASRRNTQLKPGAGVSGSTPPEMVEVISDCSRMLPEFSGH